MLKTSSLALRLVVAAGLWMAAALAIGGFLLSSLFAGSALRSFDARLVVYLEALVAGSEIDPTGVLAIDAALGDPRFDQALSGWYWQVSAPGMEAQRSRSLWDQTLATDQATLPGQATGYDIGDADGNRLRAVARDIKLPGAPAALRYIVAGGTGEIEAEIRGFNIALAWSLSVLGAGLLIALLVQVRYGLRPLRLVRQALIAIRMGEASRLEGDFPSEIAPLSNELNNLLEHNAAVVERARTHVSNLAHALKTPLAVLANEAERGEDAFAQTVRRQIAAMRGQVDHYLSRARTAAARGVIGIRTEVAPAIEDLRRTLLRLHRDRGVAIEVVCEPGLMFRGERQDLEEMLGNLIDNACKWGRSRIEVRAERREDRLHITVDDDGPGLASDDRDGLFQRGKRLDERVPGSGHGLAIVRDIAELYDGKAMLDASPLGGLRAVLDLPAAAPRATGYREASP